MFTLIFLVCAIDTPPQQCAPATAIAELGRRQGVTALECIAPIAAQASAAAQRPDSYVITVCERRR